MIYLPYPLKRFLIPHLLEKKFQKHSLEISLIVQEPR